MERSLKTPRAHLNLNSNHDLELNLNLNLNLNLEGVVLQCMAQILMLMAVALAPVRPEVVFVEKGHEYGPVLGWKAPQSPGLWLTGRLAAGLCVLHSAHLHPMRLLL